MPKLKPATAMQARDLVSAIAALKLARQYLTDADCPATLRKVRSAIKSAEGAERHMARRIDATLAENRRLLPNLYSPATDARIAALNAPTPEGAALRAAHAATRVNPFTEMPDSVLRSIADTNVNRPRGDAAQAEIDRRADAFTAEDEERARAHNERRCS